MADTEPRKGTKHLIGGAVLALFVGFGIYGFATEDSVEPAGHQESSYSESEAWAACKEAVKDRLNNPATADFSLMSTTITRNGDGYDIAGALTAENSFGVEGEIAFSCRASEGSVSADVQEAS